MKFKYIFMAGLVAAPLLLAGPAEAREYCREYTKSIRVGGQTQIGYGTACLQPDGSWKIVSTRGNVDMYDHIRETIVRRDRHAVVIPYHAPRYHRGYAYRQPPGHYKNRYKHSYKPSHKKHYKKYAKNKRHKNARRGHSGSGTSFHFKF